MKNFTLIIALSFCLTSLAQRTITGAVSDETGPLGGATVILKHSNVGVVTDFDGRFEIKAESTDTLSFSYVGYPTKDVSVNSENDFHVILEGTIELDEVIVLGFESRTVTCSTRCSWTCVSTSCGFDISERSIDVSGNFQPILFPNPSPDGLFQLNLNDAYDNVKLTIASITGQIVQTSNSQKVNNSLKIDLSNSPSGIYLINIIADGQRLKTKKAIRK